MIHGFKTIFPIPLGQAASFNPEIAETGARIAATEASVAGIRWTFAPMIDITHDPRWGRIAEGFGEDPLLVSQMGVAAIKGFQGSSLNHPTSIAACAKHLPDMVLRKEAEITTPPTSPNANSATFISALSKQPSMPEQLP